jgi:chromosome segregation ATPase
LRALERENAILRSEVTVLRAHPDAAPHPASLQISELTLALRHVSDKLTTTEETLLLRTRELAHAQGDTRTTRHALDGVIRQIDMAQQRERKSNARMRELQQRIRAAEEERKLMDIVVQEYADLVRELDARRSPSSSFTASSLTLASSDSGSGLASDAKLSTTLSEGKLGLRRLLADFGTETARLEDEIARLHAELAAVLAKSEASTKAHEENMDELAELRARLDKVQIDDRSAAQMVSRYM